MKIFSEADYLQLLKQIQETPRFNGYISPNAESRLSPIHGIGLFAEKDIAKGTVVAAWGGKVTTKEEIENLSPEIGYNYALELYPGFYLAERNQNELDSADFINHSCDENCELVDKFVMRTKFDVKAGEELTADFSNRSDKGEHFVCNCGSEKCSGVIYFN